MERISALIEKLRGQFAAGADIEQLLLTTQLLEGELRYHRQKGTVPASPHVAVLMPNNGNRPVRREEAAPVQGNFVREEAAPVRQEPAPVQGNFVREEPAPVRPAPAPTYQEPAPVWQEPAPVPRQEPIRAVDPKSEHERYLPHKEAAREKEVTRETNRELQQDPIAFNPIKDVPTLTHQIPQESRNRETRKELNEAIARENGLSLNDSLRGQQKELSTVLTEAPIRDLRKAVGINDRYVFISELFRGDEIMYERSIKTINNFSIFQEAFYWMERELKLKLAWDEDKKSVQLFYQLVRRRFS